MGVAATLGWLWLRRGIVPTPRWDPAYLRAAVRVGIPVQTSYLLVGLSARMDLLIVQSIKGSAAAGFYSVALTMGQLVFYAPVAVAVASYPVAATMTFSEVVPFIERAARMAIAAGLLCAVVLVPTLPFILPALFGAAFSTATPMALVLLAAGLLQGLQWVTCRLWAAQGRGGLLAITCGVTLAAMVTLDLVLVPAHGGMGAAIAAVVAAGAAAALALAGHRRYAGDRASLLGFVPRAEDFARIAALPRTVLRLIGGMRRA
jgi:O-antigen/teichoic acid export membrane protein